MTVIGSIGVAALVSALLVGALLPLLRRRLLDQPNARSAHVRPTPRGGGVAFVLVGSLWGLPPIPLLCLPLALVGMLDDRFDLPAGLRYTAQLLTAFGLLALAALPLPGGWLGAIAAVVLVIAITAVINFVNFTDGLDGLVAGCSAVMLAVAALSLNAAWLWPLVGALLGFLVWNWNPAKVFMGDVGSTFLGAVFAGAVLQAKDPAAALGLLLVGSPLLADALICVLRRAADGQPIFQAHRLHLFQRLHQGGWSHRQVAGLYIGSTAVGGVAFLSLGLAGSTLTSSLVVVLGCWLNRTIAAPFRQSEWAGREQGQTTHRGPPLEDPQ
jgi:UDP-N-acetylmuramyl pentapeptide phosphotransferase/UDP-N-acetylglucosamine-1-phosphate transferase